MSCQEVREFLDAYIDRELDVMSTSQFDRHIAGCLPCRAIYEQYEELRRSVKAQMPYYEAPAALQNKIRDRLRSTGSVPRERLHARLFPGMRVWTMAAVAALLVLLSIVIFQTVGRVSKSEMLAEQVVSSHVRSLMANHLFDVASSDQHTVKPWFTGKLDFAPVVKDLSAEGFPLVGGRLDYLDSRPVAALVYKHRQHTINLFVWPSRSSDSKLRSVVLNGYNIVHLTRSRMTYWAVSDLNAAELTEFVRDLEK
jgi:anti-sigma factor (TIGR02949 family)